MSSNSSSEQAIGTLEKKMRERKAQLNVKFDKVIGTSNVVMTTLTTRKGYLFI